MDSSIRYELVPDEDDRPADPDASPAIEVENVQPMASAAPINNNDVHVDLEHAVKDLKIPEPPSYSIATTLPSYEEAEQTKQSEVELQQQREAEEPLQSQSSNSPGTHRVDDVYLGTDGIFVCAFLVAFLFNCLGLFAVLCVSQTIAARFGAISGFGLSIVKYVAVMKYQKWILSWNDGFSWLWWFMLALGLLMFFRGCMQYIRIKHQWTRLSQQMRGHIYLYF